MKLQTFSVFVLCVVLVLGCERLPDGFPTVYPATVTITQGGEPLSEANVLLFNFEDSSFRWIISGCTDANGTAQLFTLAGAQVRKSGAPLGKFKVTVTKNTADDVPVAPMPRDSDAVHRAYREQLRQLKPHIHYFVEEVYTNSNTTPLEVTVEKKKNMFSLDAGKKTKRSVPMQL